MAALNWPVLTVLRRPVSLRSAFLWLLLALLLAGAASYTQGSRYTLIPNHVPVQLLGVPADAGLPLEAVTAASPADASASGWKTAGIVQHAGPAAGNEELEMDCCHRRQAPRSEPAPVRTAAADLPSLTIQQEEDKAIAGARPPTPDLPALTVIKLSISRT